MKEIGSEELPSHGFVVETLVKEIISPEAVKRMFQQDFRAVKHVAQQFVVFVFSLFSCVFLFIL